MSWGRVTLHMRFRGPASSMRSLVASGTTRLPYLLQPKKSETS